MKRVLFSLLSLSLIGQSCHDSPPSLSLDDFCGEIAVSSRFVGPTDIIADYEHNYHFYLSFEKKKGAGLITIEVSKEDYFFYKNGKTINCH